MSGAALGWFEGDAHVFPVRVYFEDTDLSGVVYHANYLRWMERARSDVMTAIGVVDQRATFERGEGSYAVAEVQIRYRAPARLGDDCQVVTRLIAAHGATSKVRQTVLRGDVVLAEAKVVAAFIDAQGRPRRQPKAWLEAFRGRLGAEAEAGV